MIKLRVKIITKKIDDYDFNWKLIYRIPRIATLELKIRIFQYKLLKNVPYITTKLSQFGIISQYLSSASYMMRHRTIFFYECTYAQNWWTKFDYISSEKVALPVLNPQSAIFGFTDVLDHNYLLVNHLLLIFKYNIYNSRVNNSLSLQSLKCVISQIKYIEETISNNDLNKKRKFSNKWKLIHHLF